MNKTVKVRYDPRVPNKTRVVDNSVSLVILLSGLTVFALCFFLVGVGILAAESLGSSESA